MMTCVRKLVYLYKNNVNQKTKIKYKNTKMKKQTQKHKKQK